MDSFEGYFDKYGLLHVDKGVYSENGILFLAEFLTLKKLNGELDAQGVSLALSASLACKKYEEDNEFWIDPNPSDNNVPDVHLSHDNLTGMYALHKLCGLSVNTLFVNKLNRRIWLHPRDLLFYTIMKNRSIGKYLVPLLIFFIIPSIIKPREVTSGKCLWFLRLHLLDIIYSSFITRSLLWLTNHILKHDHGSTPFKDVFSIYFKNVDHPINIAMEKYYESEEGNA